MTLRIRLLLSLAVMGILLIYPALYGLARLMEMGDVARRLEGPQAQATAAVGRTRTALAELDRHQRAYIVAGDPVSRRSMWIALRGAEAALDTLERAGFGAAAASVDDDVVRLLAATAEIDSLVEAGAATEATASFRSVAGVYQDAERGLVSVSRAIEREGARWLAEIGAGITATRSTIGVTAVLALTCALGLGLWTVRAVGQPILDLRNAMAGMAAGNFSAPDDLPYGRPDEIGDLSRSFRSMTEELARLQRLRAEFVSMASHELKNPLNVIGGYAEILDEGQLGELNSEQRRSLKAIHEQVSVLTRLVNQLLDLGRYEAGALDLQRDAVSVPDLLEGVVRSFGSLARQRGIEICTRISANAPLVVWGDVERLRNEVLGNLLSNAVKFTPPGGTVTVSAAADDRGLRVRVRDTGPGVPDEEVALVFEKFYQADGPARSLGAGLGLSIARDMIVAHGGQIGVESEPGAGATFWFTIPVRADDIPAEPGVVPIDRARRAS
ncbi:MAG TPA: HAMP domain-containing sensor histidine kinase [Gemmatimonadota bacterium]|nr:HAMP domain-containing sensor histidine kinase [Gemmatimonadota bacterium]